MKTTEYVTLRNQVIIMSSLFELLMDEPSPDVKEKAMEELSASIASTMRMIDASPIED